MTLLARNEADIVDAQIAFHLHAGVDFVIATDNRSTDGTTEILERYQRAGYLHLLREEGDDMRQDVWVTRMARLAATEFEADWVINSDADEFWWPRGGSLADVCGAVSHRFGSLRGVWRHFVPRPESQDPFYERMVARLTHPSRPGDMSTVFHSHQKVAHRGSARVLVARGNHDVSGIPLPPLRTWYPIEVLHFSLRSVKQLEVKSQGGWGRHASYVNAPYQTALEHAFESRSLERYFDGVAVTDAELAASLSSGQLVMDCRLRDVLRALRRSDGRFATPDETTVSGIGGTGSGIRDDGAFAGEVSLLADVDAIVRAERRAAALETRLTKVEFERMGSNVARVVRRRREPPGYGARGG